MQFKTKLNAQDKNPVTTTAEIDFSGVTTEELQKLATATVVINQQAIYRTSAVIPATDVIKVRDQIDRPRGGGFKATPESLAARISKMDETQYRETLVNLGLDDKVVSKMVAAKFKA